MDSASEWVPHRVRNDVGEFVAVYVGEYGSRIRVRDDVGVYVAVSVGVRV